MACSNRPDERDYYSKSDREHEAYCNRKNSEFECDPAEGCIWIGDSPSGFNRLTKDYSNRKYDCILNTEANLGNRYINGGWGFGKLCLDSEFTRLILMFVYPPLYIFIHEKYRRPEDGPPFKNKKAIIMCFIYTSMFYFPGLIYAMHYKMNRDGDRPPWCLM